jgi:transcriptional regulator with GAF, ATPase, and Fis domain
MWSRALHTASGRPGPFIAVNMASLVQGLCESQLFGHRRGAFSGAVADQLGVFDVAKGGTLLLDELGDLDLGLQAKLLRAVETNEIDRLGDPQPHSSDIRLVVATHRDLRRLVQQGRFREDLSWRLQRTRNEVPPLRARRLDVVPLLLHFLAEAGVPPVHELTRLRPRTGWHAADLFEQMLLHTWPGNVRELRDDAIRLADAILGRMSEHQSGPIPPVEEIVAPRGQVTMATTPVQGDHHTQPSLKPLPEVTPDEVLRCLHLLENRQLLQGAIRDDVNGNIKALAEHIAHVLDRPVAGVRRAIYRTLGGTVAAVRAHASADIDVESRS